MNNANDKVVVEWRDDSYFVRVQTDNFNDAYQIPKPYMTDKQSKAVMKFSKKIKMSEDERLSMLYFVEKSLWRRLANKNAVYYASKFWIPEENVHLVGFNLRNGKMIPTTNFWWDKNNE